MWLVFRIRYVDFLLVMFLGMMIRGVCKLSLVLIVLCFFKVNFRFVFVCFWRFFIVVLVVFMSVLMDFMCWFGGLKKLVIFMMILGFYIIFRGLSLVVIVILFCLFRGFCLIWNWKNVLLLFFFSLVMDRCLLGLFFGVFLMWIIFL